MIGWTIKLLRIRKFNSISRKDLCERFSTNYSFKNFFESALMYSYLKVTVNHCNSKFNECLNFDIFVSEIKIFNSNFKILISKNIGMKFVRIKICKILSSTRFIAKVNHPRQPKKTLSNPIPKMMKEKRKKPRKKG